MATRAGFETIEHLGDPAAPWIVILHGYGADFRDLAPLHDILQAPPGSNWVFPNGGQRVAVAGHVQGRAWFPIDMQELERALLTGQHRDFSTIIPDGFLEAQADITTLLGSLPCAPKDIILGGFSQGAMVACDVAMHLPEPPKGLLLLSSTLVAEERWLSRMENLAAVPIFQSHGQRDHLLSFAAAEKLHKLLVDKGAKAEFHSFYGGHELPQPILEKLSLFLQGIA